MYSLLQSESEVENKNLIHQNSLSVVVAMESSKVLKVSSNFPVFLPQFLEILLICDFYKHGFVPVGQFCLLDD